MAFDPKDIPGTLTEAYSKRRCGVYVGAGLSQGAGLPSWEGLLSELIDSVEKNVPALRDHVPDYRKLSGDTSKFLVLATELKEVLLGNFQDYIADRFSDTRLRPTKNHEVLTLLEPIRYIITTNYDSLIEDAFVKTQGRRVPVYNYRQIGSIQRHLFKQEFFVFKAHGDAMTVADGIILTEQDYRKLMFEHRAYQTLLATIFTTTSVIFLGTSLVDPELKLLLQSIASAFQSGGPQHYAVMAHEEMTATEMERWRKDFNIQFIPISKDNDYEDLHTFMQALASIKPA